MKLGCGPKETVMKRLSIVVAIVGIVALAFGCSGSEGVEPDDKGTLNITMEDSKFTPENIELKSGRKVRMVRTTI